MKYCPKCKYPNPDIQRECFKCGTDIALDIEQEDRSVQASDGVVDNQQLQVCPFCQSDVPQQARKCRHCGEWLAGRQLHLKRALPYCVAIIALISIVTTAVFVSRNRPAPNQSPAPLQPVPAEPTRVTVSQIRNNVLRYNQKQVIIRATIVDAAEDWTRWVIADDSDAYFRAIASKYGISGKGASADLYIYMSPRVPTLKLEDVVDVAGVYDADANCLFVKSAEMVTRPQRK